MLQRESNISARRCAEKANDNFEAHMLSEKHQAYFCFCEAAISSSEASSVSSPATSATKSVM